MRLFGGTVISDCFRRGAWLLAWVLCALFLVQAIVLLPYPGLQNDEVLFGSVIYEPRHLDDSVQIFKRKIPLMLINYLGAFKALFYALLFKIWPPSVWSVRLPVALAGAATVWLFFVLLRDTLGRRAAAAGAALLATDVTFVLTTTFDWGPVALQHLLLIGGTVLLVKWARAKPPAPHGRLAAAFFLFGLGLWDKALFVWMLTGLATAAAVVFPHELRRLFTLRRLAIALVGLCLGASPLIVYNFRHHGPTFRNARYAPEHLAAKARFLSETLEGSSLFGYLVREDTGDRRLDPPNALERASLAFSDMTGRRRKNLLLPALALAVLLLPLIWFTPGGRAALFALIAMAVAWAQMALNRDTGGSTHHTVLLWPLPHLAITAALTEAAARLRRGGGPLLAAVLLLVCGSNLLVTNEYLAQLVRHGGGTAWTDAIYSLSQVVARTPARWVIVIDWGCLDQIRTLNLGRLPLQQVMDIASTDALDERQQQALRWAVSSPANLFVGHTPDNEIIEGSGARFQAHAARIGFRKEVVTRIRDRHGRAVFELFRFRPSDTAPGGPRPG